MNALRYERPPLRPRAPLWLQAGGGEPQRIGSVENAVAQALRLQPESRGWCITAPANPQGLDAALAALAKDLQARELIGTWRNELLPVRNEQGERLGLIERAATRALGLPTHAVHLTGATGKGLVWVQQRALDKATDPGLWDTLMGGMVSAKDDLQGALARETWEEAGLKLEQLQGLEPAGVLEIRRPADNNRRGNNSVGYIVERIDWFRCTVPADMMPVNQDGEVERFEALPSSKIRADIQQGLYTLEAALILAPDLVTPAA